MPSVVRGEAHHGQVAVTVAESGAEALSNLTLRQEMQCSKGMER